MTPSVLTSWLLVALAALGAGVWVPIRLRNMQYWIGSYLAQAGRRRALARRTPGAGTSVYVCLADHYEPYGGGADRELAHARVERWLAAYPRIAASHADSRGRGPQHTFFYPLEEYDPLVLDRLADLCHRGHGDVEVHYHHDGDDARSLSEALLGFTATLRHRHGLLRNDAQTAQVAYCFIHGNWALDNSRPDGRWCGVNDEISVLVRTGCCADFTLPSAPSDTQTRKINAIYLAHGRPGMRKSHDQGRDLGVGQWAKDEELLLVQGPLGLNWKSRKGGLIPRIENGEISADAPPSAERVRLWLRLAPRIRGAEQYLFIKLYTHGASDKSSDALLGGALDILWSELERQVRDQPGFRLHYVTAWEMFCAIRDIAGGRTPGPSESRA
jgi:hypothetical protein